MLSERFPLAVIFDFDGVIVDSEPVHLRAFQQAAATEGIALTAEQYFRELIGYDDRGAWQRVFELHGRPIVEGVIERVMRTKFDLMQQLLRHGEILPFDGVAELIRALHAADRPLAICSAAVRAEVSAMLEAIGLSKYFSIVTCAEDVMIGKPDPSGYLLTLRRLSEMIGRPLGPPQCLVIEDAPAVVQSTGGAGFKTLAVANSYPLEALGHATWAVPSLRRDELRSAVPELSFLFDGENRT